MNILSLLAPHFGRYITLERVHPTKTYNYLARGFTNCPVIDVTVYGPKCKRGESWLYIAIPHGADLHSLSVDQMLYIGAQTQDRMFRGDGGIGGTNYHHAEMRAGNGDDNPVAYLRTGTRIDIYRASAASISHTVTTKAELALLRPVLDQPTTAKRHRGWWYEQLLLYIHAGRWRWNTAAADRSAQAVFRKMLMGHAGA